MGNCRYTEGLPAFFYWAEKTYYADKLYAKSC